MGGKVEVELHLFSLLTQVHKESGGGGRMAVYSGTCPMPHTPGSVWKYPWGVGQKLIGRYLGGEAKVDRKILGRGRGARTMVVLRVVLSHAGTINVATLFRVTDKHYYIYYRVFWGFQAPTPKLFHTVRDKLGSGVWDRG